MFKKLTKFLILCLIIFGSYNTTSASFTISRPSANNLGLVGHWTFDGGKVVNGVALDSSGNGYNANLINIATSTFYSTGKIGQGFDFDGSNDIASTTRINNNEITVAGWYYKDANDFVANTSDTVFGAYYWNANTQLQEGFDLRGGEYPSGAGGGCTAGTAEGYLCAKFIVVSTNGTTKTQKNSFFNMSTISKNGTTTQEWFHIAGTYTQSDGNQRLYVNGVLRDTDLHVAGNTVVPLATTTAGACYMKMNIGYGCVNNGWFDGKIDDVRLYNRALSAGEIKNLYNQGVSKFNKSPINTLTSGLVGYWTFDGADTNWTANTTTDKSTSGNTGTMTNMSTTSSPAIGRIGQGFNFDGADDVASLSSILPLIPEFTVSSWVKVDDLAATRGIFISRNSSNAGFRYRIGTNGFVLLFIGNASTFDTLSTNTNALVAGTFYHITVTGKSADFMRIYVNGVLMREKTTTQVLDYVPNAVGYIGSAWNTSTELMKGVVDDVRLYNRALSAGEVAQLYNQGVSKFNKSPTKTLTSGLVGYWTFDGADTNWTANTTTDKSTSGNTGTMTNMSTTSSPAIGKIGQGFLFDGADDYVNAGNGSSLNVVGNITISAWVKFDNANDKDVIVSRDNGGPGDATAWSYEFGRDITTNKFFLYSDGSGGEFQSVNSSSVITDVSNWHHVAVTKSSSIVTFFIDGVLDNSATMTQNFPSTSHSLHIGTENYSVAPTEKFDGLIDDVRIYNRALSAGEVKMLYNMGR